MPNISDINTTFHKVTFTGSNITLILRVNQDIPGFSLQLSCWRMQLSLAAQFLFMIRW